MAKTKFRRKPSASKRSSSQGSSFLETIITLALMAIIAVAVYYLVSYLVKDNKRECFAGKERIYKLVYVYSASCPHCQAFEPKWTKFNDELKNAGLTNVTTEKTTDSKTNGVSAFPTVVLYQDGTKNGVLEGNKDTTEVWTFLRAAMEKK
jgi:thiol-disulfide isomerase/thioredoxin